MTPHVRLFTDAAPQIVAATRGLAGAPAREFIAIVMASPTGGSARILIATRADTFVFLGRLVGECPGVLETIDELAAFYESEPLLMPVVLDVGGSCPRSPTMRTLH